MIDEGETKEKTNIMGQICFFCKNPITKMNGPHSDSLCEHHISYVPEVVVTSHIGCHIRYHRTHPKHPKNPNIEHRERYIESLGESVICHFCKELIIDLSGNGAKSLAIHSLDGNHDKWNPVKKVPTHYSCHSSFHQSGRIVSKETREKLSELNQGNNQIKTWEIRRERYGPTGLKDPEAVYRARSERMKNGDSAKIWETRRQRYGSSGFKDLNRWKEVMVEGRKDGAYSKGWETRRALYGPSGSR